MQDQEELELKIILTVITTFGQEAAVVEPPQIQLMVDLVELVEEAVLAQLVGLAAGVGGGSAINDGAPGTLGDPSAGGAAGTNSGGGGGSSGANHPSGAGGSGIVIIRYKFQ